MFIQNLFEDAPKRVVVTYPGRFQPFHKGHAEVFANLQRKFGSDNVFIVTSNKTDGGKSPFNFSDKVRFMNAMGIPNHQIIETDKVYDLPSRFEPIKDQVVFITVVGKPDEARLAPGRTKKDGEPGYFQQIPPSSNEFKPATEHGYVMIEPEHPENISIGGKTYDVSHGTPCRALWNQVRDNPQQRAEFVQQLYGKSDAELASTLDKIPNGAAPAPEPAKKMKNVKKDLTKVQHDPNAEQPVAEAGYGSNRGYSQGFASPHAPSLGRRGREDDEYHVPDPTPSTWYIRADGKIIKDKMGTPFQYRDKETARKAAMTMMAKPFNAGKKFMLTTKPQDDAPVAEDAGTVTHRIGLTVTDPNHPMVSKRGETYQKTVRVKGPDREKAINGAIAHARRKGYKVHDHHYIGTVDSETMAEAGKGISKDAETKFHAKLDKLVHDTFGRRDSEQGMAEGVAESMPLNDALKVLRQYGAENLKTTTNELHFYKNGKAFSVPLTFNDDATRSVSLSQLNSATRGLKGQGVAEGSKYKCSCHPGDPDPDCPVHGLEPMGVGDALDIKKGVAEGAELKQAKRKYNQAAKDANDDQVGAGKKIDTMKKSLRQKDVDNKKQGMAEGKKSDNYHIVDKDGKPASLASYADRASAEKDRDAKHPGAQVRQVGPRGKVKGVSEGLNENAEELNIGDPVIITGQGIEFEGKTGDIDSFGDMKRFVVVNLYNHGRHSFHSSDVSYNDHADQEDDLDEDLYQYDKEDPYNSEFAPRAGMGRMTLRGWKQQMIKRTAELAQQMSAAGQDIDKSAIWDHVYAKLKSMNMDPIAQEIEQAQAELEKIRQRGGVRSRAFNK